jgi:hypothetical protein
LGKMLVAMPGQLYVCFGQGRPSGTTGKSLPFYRILSSPKMKKILLYRN